MPKISEMQKQFSAAVVTYEDGEQILPGGMCSCCGSGPDVHPDWREEPWYVYRTGLCDSDGVYYSQLCEGCLEDVRHENMKRPETERDAIAREISELMGDDIDGAQTFMDDLDA